MRTYNKLKTCYYTVKNFQSGISEIDSSQNKYIICSYDYVAKHIDCQIKLDRVVSQNVMFIKSYPLHSVIVHALKYVGIKASGYVHVPRLAS